jgi:dTDP-4-dehydrorhamnose reductase
VSGILVTGGTGQLARALAARGGLGVGGLGVVGRPDFDFDRPDSIDAVLNAAAPELVINTAAWTAVDAAEGDEEGAWRANAAGPARIAAWCAASGAGLIHISTDYVFDGGKGAPYVEDDPTAPTGVYGATKLEGERAVLASCPSAIILRTAWVYAETGKNFLRTMLNAARKTDRLRVVSDQVGNPTNADDLAAAILAVAGHMRNAGSTLGGVFHAAGTGETSWHGFATEIFRLAGPLGWPTPVVDPITTADWPTPARRPADSRLDCGRLHAVFGHKLPDWRESLVRAVAALCYAEHSPPG